MTAPAEPRDDFRLGLTTPPGGMPAYLFSVVCKAIGEAFPGTQIGVTKPGETFALLVPEAAIAAYEPADDLDDDDLVEVIADALLEYVATGLDPADLAADQEDRAEALDAARVVLAAIRSRDGT